MHRITTKYTKRQSDLITTGQRVIEKMENNPSYPNPPAALSALKVAVLEFLVAIANAQGRDKEMVSIKNDKKSILQSLLQELGEYVMATSKGDRTMLLNSGFDVTSGTRGASQPPFIAVLEVEVGLTGTATTRVKNSAGVKAFIHQYTTEPPGLNSVWIGEGSSTGTYTFERLSSDKRYWFRVVGIGFNKQRAYSPIVSRLVE